MTRSLLRQLAATPTVADVLAQQVDGLTPVTTEELSSWLHQRGLPVGWLAARSDAGDTQPARIAVYGSQSDGSWEGSETVSVFRFTGIPPEQLVIEASAQMMRDLRVENATTEQLDVSSIGRVATAVRSKGYLDVAGQRIWLQYSTYLVGSETAGGGLLIEHGIFAMSDRQASLSPDIVELGDAVYQAFVGAVQAAAEVSTVADGVDMGGFPFMKGKTVATFHVEPFDEAGTPAILVNANRPGMRVFLASILSAHEHGAAVFTSETIKHYVVRQDEAADIDVRPLTVVWRFDDANLLEIADLITPLIESDHPCHAYFDDLRNPVETLVLSVDEYKYSYDAFPQFSWAPSSSTGSRQPLVSSVEDKLHQEVPQAEPLPHRDV